MLPFLGNLIQKHPVVVITIIVMITLGFSLFIPAIEFKTDFEEFTPDDEIVKANERIQDYFGEDQQLILVYAKNEKSPHILTSESIRDIYYFQQELEKEPEVEGSFSIATFLDMICLIQFGSSLMNCTDDQIQTALQDLFVSAPDDEIKVFRQDDPNEEYDYARFPRIQRGKSIDSGDIKNCYISSDEHTITFSFEVYDLIDLTSSLQPVFPQVNVMEWYIAFQNQVTPIEDLNISYKLAVHLEPQEPLWVIGNSFIENMKHLFNQIKQRTLFNNYKKEGVLWIQPSGQNFSIPLSLSTADITFIPEQNQIDVSVSFEELSDYGIGPRFGSFFLPAKLIDFQAGTRYYQKGFFNRGGGRIDANTSSIINRLFNLQNRPIVGGITEKFLQRYGELSWQEFEEYYQMIESADMIPERISLRDIESNWNQADIVPDSESTSDVSFLIAPAFYQDLRLDIRSFLSRDYEKNNQPSSTLIFLELTPTKNYDEIIRVNKNVVKDIEQVDKAISTFTARATGMGINTAEINELTTQANQFIAPSIFIIIVFILFVNFRRISYVVLPMLALVVSTIWLFGAMALMGIPFNVISIALIPLILGLGVDYSVHLFHNYRVELRKGKSPAEAVKNSVSEIGTAMFLAMTTTVIAFLSFLTASVPPVRDFGILLALGVIFTFITAITLLVSLRYLLDQRSTVKIKRKQQGLAVQKIMGKISQKVLQYQKTILVVMTVITVLFSLQALQIKTGYDTDQFAPKDTPSFKLYDLIAEEFPFSSQTQNFILIEGNVATVEALSGIRETHEKMKDDTYIAKNRDGSLKVTSIYTYIKQVILNNESIVSEFNVNPDTFIPRSDTDVKALYDYLYDSVEKTGSIDASDNVFAESMDDADMSSFDLFNGEIKSILHKQGNTYNAAVIRIYLATSFSTIEGNMKDELEILHQEITQDIASYGSAEAMATGPNLINLEITNNLTESQILSTVISIILAALVLILVYRNLSLGLIALIPVGISIIWILGTMNLIGYSLNVLTITVTSITIGIGIDYAIHATERFRFIIDKTGDIQKAVCETISHTGGALLIAALTTALGFIILVFAPIPPQQQFGLILSVTIAYSFLTSIFLLPLVIYHWAMRRKKKKGYVVNSFLSENGKE